jgi:DnaJ homolog subfamily A member 2
MGPDVDFEDILQMFGMGMGGVPPGFGPGGPGPRRPRKGMDEEKRYEVTLEELYKGKTTKFASTKNVLCSVCKGTGGKEKAKPKPCATCQGRGTSLQCDISILSRSDTSIYFRIHSGTAVT